MNWAPVLTIIGLLGACLVTSAMWLWTHDHRLAAVAARLGVDAASA